MSERAFTFFLCGSAGSGKTSYVSRLRGEPFCPLYAPTSSPEVVEVTLRTKEGPVSLRLVDTNGGGLYNELDLRLPVDGVLVFFDLSSSLSHRESRAWSALVRQHLDVPLVLVGNKSDVKDRKISLSPAPDVYQLSVKEGNNLEMPLLSLLRRLLPE